MENGKMELCVYDSTYKETNCVDVEVYTDVEMR